MMDRSFPDYSDARAMMVDGQVRPNKVTDPRILDAMRGLPRERFVIPQSMALAYADEDVPLGDGRVLMEPMVIARLVQLLGAQRHERALVVGAGTGYGAALLAACGAQVTALEENTRLLDLARSALDAAGVDGVRLQHGKLAEGWAAGAPFDMVLIEGAVAAVPPVIADQVRRPDGRLVTVRAMAGRVGQAVRGEPSGNAISLIAAFDCATPLLPELRPAPGFVF